MSRIAFQSSPVSVASHTRTQPPRAARRQLTCRAMRDFNVPALSLGALAAAQLALGAPAFAEINFDTSKLGAPAQNKEATDLPSSFFKAGDTLQSKLGLQPDNLNKDLDSSNSGGAANAPNFTANQKDFAIDGGVQDIANAGKKLFQNITPGDIGSGGRSQDILPKSEARGLSTDVSPDVGKEGGAGGGNIIGEKVPNAGKASIPTPDGLGGSNV